MDSWEEDGRLVIIEEFISGVTLRDMIESTSSPAANTDLREILTVERIGHYMAGLCDILERLHSHNPPLIHRDLKPSNIIITSCGNVMLLDFNAARFYSGEPGRESDTRLLGTKGYAAPEQYGFGPSSVLSDIYSVGVLMNVMLTGELPNKRIAGGRLNKVIRKCVELSPSGRYQSISQLQRVLDELAFKPAPVPRKNNWKKYLPPGFRNSNVIKWLFSAVGYVAMFAVGLDLQVENAGIVELIINRISFTAMCLCIVLFNGNYLNVHRHFILTRSKKKWVRWLGMGIVDCALVALWVITTDLLVTLFVH
jgi:serine/threonine protein kinase